MSATAVFKKIEDFGIDVEKGITYPFRLINKISSVLDSAIKDEPALQGVLKGFIQQATVIAADSAQVYATKGIDLTSDATAITAIKNLFTYFTTTVLPEIEKVYEDVKSDIELPPVPSIITGNTGTVNTNPSVVITSIPS